MAMALDDGLISGLREDQLVTAEEVDSAVREVSNLYFSSPRSSLHANVLRMSLNAQSIDQAIGVNAFQHSKVNAWTANIVVRFWSERARQSIAR